MNTESFNEVHEPDEDPERGFELGLIFAFLNFHRRTILGMILVAAVAYFLVHLNKKEVANDVDADSIVATVQTSAFPGSQIAQAPEEQTAPVVPLKPKTTNQRLDQLLDSATAWAQAAPAEAVITLKQRLAELKALLGSQDLTPSQRKYCVYNYIDSVGALSGYHASLVGGVQGIDGIVAEVDQIYGASENEEVAAAAKVVLVCHKMAKFLTSRGDEDFADLQEAFMKNLDVISKSTKSWEFLARSLAQYVKDSGNDDRLCRLAADHLERIVVSAPSDLIATELANSLFFLPARVNMKTLSMRVKAQVEHADEDVQFLFGHLKKHPNMPVTVYSMATTAINSYHKNGKHDKAKSGLEKLREIEALITVCLLYTSPSPRDQRGSRMPSSA